MYTFALGMLVLSGTVQGLTTGTSSSWSLTSMTESAVHHSNEVAKTFAKAMQRKLKATPPAQLHARAAEVAKKMNISQEQTQGALSQQAMRSLMQEIQIYAQNAKERYIMEAQSGVTNKTRMQNHRKALGLIMKEEKKTIKAKQSHTADLCALSTEKGNDEPCPSAGFLPKHFMTTSVYRVIFAESLYWVATYYILNQGEQSLSKGVEIFAMFWIMTVLMFMDAGWGLVDALYATLQIPTTIGWGDMGMDFGGLEDTGPMQLYLTMHVILSGLLLTPGTQDLFDLACFGPFDRYFDGRAEGSDNKEKVFGSIALLFVTFGIGAYFYSSYESCTCSFGPSFAEGCIESDCENTGGYTMNFLDALYMMVTSATSIGYGDFTPHSWLGRILAIPIFYWAVACNNHVAGIIRDGLSELWGLPQDKEKKMNFAVASMVDAGLSTAKRLLNVNEIAGTAVQVATESAAIAAEASKSLLREGLGAIDGVVDTAGTAVVKASAQANKQFDGLRNSGGGRSQKK